jgi:hypothetical protein
MYKPEIELDNSFAEAPPDFKDLKARVDAAIRTMEFMDQKPVVQPPEKAEARAVFAGALPHTSEVMHKPAVIVHLKLLLSEYDKEVVANAAQLRTYVTNRLIEESDNSDPRVRMKALELLGKISDVGLFTDKSEVTYRHRPTEELERLLKERLAKVLEIDPEEEKRRRLSDG